MRIKAIRVDIDGSVRCVEIASIRDVCDQVGGDLHDLSALSSETARTTLWCSEEGKHKGLPVNLTGTMMLYALNPLSRRRYEYVVGAVLATGAVDDRGIIHHVGNEAIQALEDIRK